MTEGQQQPKPGQGVLLKENPAAYLRADAETALTAARTARQESRTREEESFARSATLLYFIALEGLVNFIYEWAEVPTDDWRRWSVTKKWRHVTQRCAPCLGAIEDESGRLHYQAGDPVESPWDDADLFKRFLELRAVRNQVVHSGADFRWAPRA